MAGKKKGGKAESERGADGDVGGPIDLEKLANEPEMTDDEIKELLARSAVVDDTKPEKAEKPAKKAPAKKAAVEEPEEEEENEEEEEEEEEENEEEEEENEEEKPTKPAKGNSAQRRIQQLSRNYREEKQRVATLQNQLNELLTRSAPKDDPAKKINDELDDLYVQVEKHRADNKTTEAAVAQRRIDALNRELGKLETTSEVATTTSRSAEVQRYNAKLDFLETEFDELNEESDDVDDDMVDKLATMTAGYRARGMAPSDALEKAASRLMGFNPFNKKELAAHRKAQDEATPKKRKTDIKKNADIANRQPPKNEKSRVGADDVAKIDASKLSDAEWAKLPEKVKARMRGDVVTTR